MLVLGASGGLAVKAARLLGAGRVVAAGRRREVLGALHADATIDLTLDRPAPVAAFADAGPIDVIVDCLRGPPVEALTNAHVDVAPGEGRDVRLVAVGEMAGARIALPSGALRSCWPTILGSGTGNFPPPERQSAYIADIFAQAAAGRLAIDAEGVPLAEVADE